MGILIEKVTVFVTRQTPQGTDLLLFEHPNAGIQIPAGTVEAGELPEAAALREAAEETGLSDLRITRSLGVQEDHLPDDQRLVASTTPVYPRPNASTTIHASLRNGLTVSVRRRQAGFSQVTYEEFDQLPDPQYVSLSITGWVPDQVLADIRRRHFFHLTFDGESEERWVVFTDNHLFTLFWAPLGDLPSIVSPQDRWLSMFIDQS